MPLKQPECYPGKVANPEAPTILYNPIVSLPGRNVLYVVLRRCSPGLLEMREEGEKFAFTPAVDTPKKPEG